MKILAIDTSCDETAAAVTEGTRILSNVIFSQASLHAKWGGVVPSLAKRKHQERIDWVIEKAIRNSKLEIRNLDAIAVTIGPGLAVALEVGINKAKEISEKYNKKFIAVDHIEGHCLSPLARSNNATAQSANIQTNYPALGVVTSGGHTEVIKIEKVGKYKILAQTVDDALGEALDKAARMLGLGYPGGAALEKIAKEGDPNKYPLPIPLAGQEKRMIFSYSGIKTSLMRKIASLGKLSRKDVSDLAAGFQQTSFAHFTRVLDYMLKNERVGEIHDVLAGGGVMANITLRKMLRDLCEKYDLKVHFPYSKKLYGDNAAMIGVAAAFKYERSDFVKDLDKVDRIPNLKIDSEL